MKALGPAKILFFCLMLIVTNSTCTQETEKIWPDVSCYPVGRMTPMQRSPYTPFERILDSCLDSEKTFGYCPKLCYLAKLSIISARCDNCNASVRNGWASNLFYSHGIDVGPRVVDKVKDGLKQCGDNHPEIATLKIYAPCDDKWNPFLSCVEKVYGCDYTGYKG